MAHEQPVSGRTHDHLKKDFFLTLTIAVGPTFYGKVNPESKEEVTELLKNYAGRATGLLKDIIELMSRHPEYVPLIPLSPLRELPNPSFASATGGCTVQYGLCGTHTCTSKQMPEYSVTIEPGLTFVKCVPCMTA